LKYYPRSTCTLHLSISSFVSEISALLVNLGVVSVSKSTVITTVVILITNFFRLFLYPVNSRWSSFSSKVFSKYLRHLEKLRQICYICCRSDSDTYFVGSGADELFAGYARHRTRFECGSVDSVVEECEAELQRLGCRNGGRDARVAT
uniref:Asparagine synthetase domain-containing protein n=1 Tax=Angiostrongylus costaricensis TaxID=334426 RepID=A0A158PD69_ANGCS